MLFTPLVGASIGFALFFFVFITPAVLTIGYDALRPESLLAICLFGGLFSEHIEKWLATQVRKILE